jgi:hypothetical protein
MGVEYRGMNHVMDKQEKLPLDVDDFTWLRHTFGLASGSLVPQHKMAAVIIAPGCKRAIRKTNIVGDHYVQKRWRPLTTHVHAEINCLIASTPKSLLDGTIYVARYRRNGTASCSYPCTECTSALLSTKLRYLVCYDATDTPTKVDLRTVK